MKKNRMENTAVRQSGYQAEIAALVRSTLAPRLMAQRLLSYHAADIAGAMALLTKEERRRLCGILPAGELAEVLSHAEERDAYLAELPIRRRAELLSRMEPAEAAEHLGRTDKDTRSLLLELMEPEARREIALLNSFDEDEIGSKLSTNYIALPAGIGVRQAMRELVEQAAENDNVSTIYVVDRDGTLAGAIDLKDLIIARETTQLEAITMTSYPYVYASEQIEDCIERIKDSSEDSIPVLDAENKLRGVLTSQEITQLVDDELGEDYAKLAGLSAEEDLQEPLKKSIGKRLPWLVILLGLGRVVSSVVGLFEGVVAHLTIIISFQSLILDMAGNVGTQSLAVTIRVLMDEQLSGRQKLFLVGKEARVGLANGAILGVLSFALIGLYLIVLKGQTAVFAFSVSFCTGAALVASILLSSVCGTVVPLIFKKLNIDPAVASGPLITTINDLVAVVTYYGLAWLLLIELLHL